MNVNDDSFVHITYFVEVNKKASDEHNDGGEIMVHSKADLEAIVKAFHALGFKVNVQRRSQSYLMEEIEGHHDD